MPGTDSERYQPLSVRTGARDAEAYDALHEGVPEWLRDSLWDWVAPVVVYEMGPAREVRAAVIREIERVLRFRSGWDGQDSFQGYDQFRRSVTRDDQRLLDVVDFLCSDLDPAREMDCWRASQLEDVLAEAGSAWTVAKQGSRYQLEPRVNATVRAAAASAMHAHDRAGDLLARAWASTYGRTPNPSEGYRNAVRAVEAAACPLVLPDDQRATLGKVIAHLRDASHQWRLVFQHTDVDRPVSTLGAMMALLWQGQHDRHVNLGDDEPLHVSQAEAEAGVHLAATLVQWLTAGVLTRRPDR